MFGKKSCSRCGKSLKKDYDFCPYCGSILDGKKNSKSDGMLGKDDSLDDMNNFMMPMGLGSLFNSLMNNFERQFKDSGKKQRSEKNNISISMSLLGGMQPQIKINQPPEDRKTKKEENIKKFFFGNSNSPSLKNFQKFPRAEPKTNMKRIGNKIFYEVSLPGVKSTKDISILNLESSMELKAVSDRKAYAKRIPFNFPIVDYKFSKGKLILELLEGN